MNITSISSSAFIPKEPQKLVFTPARKLWRGGNYQLLSFFRYNETRVAEIAKSRFFDLAAIKNKLASLKDPFLELLTAVAFVSALAVEPVLTLIALTAFAATSLGLAFYFMP